MIQVLADRYVRVVGALCPLVITTGTAATAYEFFRSGRYDYLRLLWWPISALGVPGVSPHYLLFNGSLLVGAVLMALYVLGLRRHLANGDSRIFLAAGMGASLALVFIGLYPAPSTIHHIATVSVFLCIAVLGGFISSDMRAKSQSHFPRWLIYPGALAAASSVAFVITLLLDRGLTPGAFQFAITTLPDEPVVNGVMVLEWIAFFSVQVLALLIAATLRRDAPEPVAREPLAVES